MYKKIFLILILLVTMVFSVSAEILDYDTFNRADSGSVGVSEGLGNSYTISDSNSNGYLSIKDNTLFLNMSVSEYTSFYVGSEVSGTQLDEFTVYVRMRLPSENLYYFDFGTYTSSMSSYNSFIWGSSSTDYLYAPEDAGFYNFDVTPTDVSTDDWVDVFIYYNVAQEIINITLIHDSQGTYTNDFTYSSGNKPFRLGFDADSSYKTVAYIDEWAVCDSYDLNCKPTSNTEPVINSISPSTRVELKQGETQLYTANVTDTEGDATYSWEVGGVEVSTSETYTADWDDIEAGIYTLRLTVSDAEYSDTTTQTLEIRAVGGSPSSGSSGGSTITTTTSIDDNSEETTKIQPKQQNIFEKILDWFKNLFSRG